ncbi:hypothetical protein BH23GEM11_BH23GEM11_01930 [soil metagenome]
MHRPMYRLRTLGGLKLDRNGSPLDAVESQRKALALLAALAVQESLGRERMQALLWPESGPDRARGSLKQLVHVLRRQLAAPNLLLGTAELRLNPDVIASDVREFMEALRDGRPEEAVSLYGGPFLDGVHIEDGSEFERWLDGWRADLEGKWRGALEILATDAAARKDPLEAVGWWRRVQAADRLNARVAVRLMEALEAAGDRAGALRHARVHELLVGEELGLPADPGVAELAERLRRDVRPASQSIPSSPRTQEEGRVPADTPREEAQLSPVPASAARRERAGHGTLLVAGLVVALAVAAGVAFESRRDRGGGAADDGPPDLASSVLPAAPTSLAVLPFVDLSEAGDQEYLADGITEELLIALSGIPDLRVPARASSFHFRGSSLPGPEIARQLGVDVLVGGSVRRSGDRIRVTVQLVDGLEDRLLWSDAVDEEEADVFEIPILVAGRVARALRLRMAQAAAADPPVRARTPDPLAHDQYLRGLFHWNRRSAPDLVLALQFFEESTRIDPDYGRPWAGLALVYAVLPIGFEPGLPPAEAWTRLEAAASRALELDPTLAEAHAARGLGLHFAWRWEEAESAYLRALELNPGYATAHQWYGEHLAKLGRGEEGAASVRHAISLDPFSLVARNDLGLALMLGGKLDAAQAEWEEIVQLDPGFAIPHYFLHRVMLMTGQIEAAAASGRRWADLTGAVSVNEIQVLTRAVAEPGPGPAGEARSILASWERAAQPRWHDIAFYLVLLGEHDEAIGFLERGVSARHPMMAQIIAAPWVDPLRGDPRMERLTDRLLRGG